MGGRDDWPESTTLLAVELENVAALQSRPAEDWHTVRDRARRVCREVWTSFGADQAPDSDGSFAVFRSPGVAVQAAIEALRRLSSEVHSSGHGGVAPRVGLHCCAPRRHEAGYARLDKHTVAQVASAAHGGQVLASEIAARVLESGGSPVELRDLGLHQLPDLPDRVRLFQVLTPGLADVHGPPRTQGGAGRLPTMLTPTVGRDGELEELAAALSEEGVRLVTLTGPGGSGKTRLATALAAKVAPAFPDGVHFVPLAAVTGAYAMWATMAQVLDVPPDGHIPPGFFDYVGERQALVILDNVEQIPDADVVVRTLLASAPHLSLLLTSRRPLHVTGEHEHKVPPLLLPTGSSFEAVAASGAVRMLVDSAQRVRKDFGLTPDNASDVAALVVALDGLPLAIELVAARLKVFSPKAILGRIDSALDLRSADRSVPERQQTIRDTIAWSCALLTTAEQTVLDHLGVFDGGADLPAVEAVVPRDELGGADVVDLVLSLVDASLVVVSESWDGEPRFTLLETIRRFALDRLEARGELASAAQAHAQHYFEVVHSLNKAIGAGERASVRRRFTLDVDNLTATVARGAAGIKDLGFEGTEGMPAVRVIDRFLRLAVECRRFQLGLEWAERASRDASWATDPLGAAACLQVLAEIKERLGEVDAAIEHARTSVALLRDSAGPEEDWPRATPGRLSPPDLLVIDLFLITSGEIERRDLDGAQQAAQECLEVSTRLLAAGKISGGMHSDALRQLAFVALEREDFETAERYLTEVGALLREAGNDFWLTMWAYEFAQLEAFRGDTAAAHARLRDITEPILAYDEPETTVLIAELLADVVGRSYPLLAARAFGASSMVRFVEGMPAMASEARYNARAIERARELVPDEWDAAFTQGRTEDLGGLMREMAALPVVEPS
ncbi:ATP-binding protein [Nocardioides halotolerans]|uniref:ATP-binding protein n=1 Tax=Nocardioides halotolerans TaxID=433660 RepID=UPI000402EAF0|nr:AAA family ATPase [Nocardioides halotolerans]